MSFMASWGIATCAFLSASGTGPISACYRFRDRLASWRVLERLADISYPLYVIHGFVGYCYMRVFVSVWDRPDLGLLSLPRPPGELEGAGTSSGYQLSTLCHSWLRGVLLHARFCQRLGPARSRPAIASATAWRAGGCWNV